MHVACPNMDDVVRSDGNDQIIHQPTPPISPTATLASPNEQDVVMSNENDPSIYHTAEPFTAITQFELFSHLPDAIQEKIMSFSLPGPRLIEIIALELRERESVRDQFFGHTTEPVAHLAVCRKWREHALKEYPLSFSVGGEEALIPFNFETDALYFGAQLGSDNAIKFKRQCAQWELAEVKHLVVDSQINWGLRRWDQAEQKYDRGYRLGQMSHKLFRGLEEYTCVFTDNKDPLPIWAPRHWFPRLPGLRTNNVASETVTRIMMANWPTVVKVRAAYLTEQEREENRFGGISWEQKREYQIKGWDIPKIAVLGLYQEVIDGFNDSDNSCWAEILMDRAIEDIFD